MMFAMLYIVLYILDGYLDWYFKDYVTLHYSVIIIVLYIMFLQVARTNVIIILKTFHYTSTNMHFT